VPYRSYLPLGSRFTEVTSRFVADAVAAAEDMPRNGSKEP
jgi:hypothetical protein